MGGDVPGYPTAVGFFAATLVVLVTVPLVKLASTARGWTEEHVYVQPREGQYEAALRSLAEAMARSGARPVIDDVPRHMVLATTIMRTLAGGAVAPFVADKLRRVTSDGVEMYLYPGDLLMRGTATRLAHVRAMFGRTELHVHAYLVEAEGARHAQDELARLAAVLDDRTAHGRVAGSILATRLREVYREMTLADVPYEQWNLLDAMARRFERRPVARGVVTVDAMPLEVEPDGLAKLAEQGDPMPVPRADFSIEAEASEVSTRELVDRAVDDVKQLARVELALAKQDLRAELRGLRRAAIELAMAFTFALVGLASLVIAIVLTTGGAKLAFGFGIGSVALAAVLAGLGYSALPKHPLQPTRDRLADDVAKLKEHLA